MRCAELDNWLSAAMMWAAIGYPFGAINKDGMPGRDAQFFYRITEFDTSVVKERLGKWRYC
ncbi:MAG: hypothetical protein ACYS9C_20175 [Planctomycetota bacterium]